MKAKSLAAIYIRVSTEDQAKEDYSAEIKKASDFSEAFRCNCIGLPSLTRSIGSYSLSSANSGPS
ncbi:MAG: hypothetical protein ACOYBV_02560, partial [Candidatus Avilachnospira sp.]